MNKKHLNKVSLFAAMLFWGGIIRADNSHVELDHSLDVFGSSPPAFIYVQDSNGNITGADPASTMDAGGNAGKLQAIPNSYVDAVNIASDDPASAGQPGNATAWSISILDHPAETFLVDLVGVQSGLCELFINENHVVQSGIPTMRSVLNVLVSKGAKRQIQVSFNPTQNNLTITPTVNVGDFLRDTQLACGLNAFGPAEVCEAMEGLASKIEKARAKDDPQVETVLLNVYLAILDRLHYWGKDGFRKDWDDFLDQEDCQSLCKHDVKGTQFFVKDPVYSALTLDAQTLLDGLATAPGNDGRGNRR